MKYLIMNAKQIEKIYFGESERFEVIKEGEWENEYKNQHSKWIIFKDSTTDLLYRAWVYRDGSYYSEYYWGSEFDNDSVRIFPIREVEVVVKKYETYSGDEVTEYEDFTE